MRDPERIDPMLQTLRQAWLQNPDLMLGQLIMNAACMRDPEIIDVYSIEDDSLRKGLLRYIEVANDRRKERR